MRENKVKRTLRAGGVALGTMVFEFNTTGIARIAAEAGVDFVIFDMEHTGWSMETIRMLMATARAANVAPMVRVPATQYHFLARVLDVGAMGIMVPLVESDEQARQIVQFAKYPPQGRRGTAFGIAHDDYQDGDMLAKIRSANEEQLLIAQVETAQGLENVEQIAAVEGIDVLWIGHNDLTTSMGIPGEFTHPRYLEAVQRIVAASQRHGKTAGFMASGVEQGRALLQQGFRCLAYWGDLWIYKQALRQGISALRPGHPTGRG
jgi:2-dehydro-3-deoxyglucarate aldolase/4-hydroxy-2-oxoheptanedioate aldolase